MDMLNMDMSTSKSLDQWILFFELDDSSSSMVMATSLQGFLSELPGPTITLITFQ
ncbi:hypothetical protein PDE_05120 [Penicillium oxalicum 114-2]|uniref:Uncharacterized protein n=1 Tax=Penicillium oxalicum (strain 114-2 / CGMCC 5302) TaxID=933388 RepID=S7ZHM7_PENO1|nr:hypothetical protein PDE_05120 [Penicillium oxalicum 114-2]